MRKGLTYLGLALLVFLMTACIRKDIDDCPPLRVQIAVKDKNYENIDFVEKNSGLDHRLDEDEPFSFYINKVYYALYRIGETKPFHVQHLYDPEEEEKVHTVEFPQDLPFGNYAMVVWANIDDETGLEDAGTSDAYRLHGEHWEGYDVYMACDTLHYNERHANFLLPLERVKGKLLITAEGMPETIRLSHKEVDNLYQEVDCSWHYSGREKVRTLHRWDNGLRNLFTDTYLAPTLAHQQSAVRVHFVQDAGSNLPLLDPATVRTNMKRNSITVLRYIYNEEDHDFDVYILLDDGWTLIHDMDVED